MSWNYGAYLISVLNTVNCLESYQQKPSDGKKASQPPLKSINNIKNSLLHFKTKSYE
jgi:hypothetical protein